jgi:hypothetical protein
MTIVSRSLPGDAMRSRSESEVEVGRAGDDGET